MSKGFLMLAAAALMLVPAISFAAPKTKCPGAIVDLKAQKYQTLGRSAKCYAKPAIAEDAGLTSNQKLCINGQFATVTRIDAAGEGPAFTKTFVAGTVHPKIISSYDTEGTNRFSFSLIERKNRKTWEHVLGYGPFSDEESYLNETQPGQEYYIWVKPMPKKVDGERQYGNWTVTVLTNPDDF